MSAKVENPVLLAEMKSLSTENDVTNFVQKYKNLSRRMLNGGISSTVPNKAVQDLIDLISYNATGVGGYIVKDGDSAIFQQSLDKKFCEQFITTQLVLDLFRSPKADFTQVLKSITVSLASYLRFSNSHQNSPTSTQWLTLLLKNRVILTFQLD